MTELFAALVTAWDADLTLTDVPNPFLGLAPDDATYPRATFAVVGQKTRDTFSRTVIQSTDLQVTIWHTTLATLQSYAYALENLLHHPVTKLATEAPVAVMSQRQTDRIDRIHPDQASGGETVYETTQTFRIETHRDLPS